MPAPARTYQKASGTYYIRLLIPKHLQPKLNRSKVVYSLGTKDRKTAFVRALKINLEFEEWIKRMAIEFDDDVFRRLKVTLPNGTQFDYDLSKPEEKSAYDGLLDTIGVLPVQTRPSIKQHLMAETFPLFKNSKKTTLSEATQAGYFPKIQGFIEYCHANKVQGFDEVDKSLVETYRDHLLAIKNSPLTIDKYMNACKQFFDYAIAVEKYGKDNPFSNMHLVKKSLRKKLTKSYIPFTDKELSLLFALPGYAKRFRKPDLFYGPLLALTMGFRLEELAQLRIADITSISMSTGVMWIIDVNDNGDDKEVKTESSKRNLPIPRNMLKTNFIAYYEYVKRLYGEEALLFPYLVKTKNGYGKGLGYNFTEHKQKLITTAPELKVFHSFRKNIGNAMKTKGYDQPTRKRILGHLDDDVTEEVYSGEYALEYLFNSLNKLSWPIDFQQYQFDFEGVMPNLMRVKERREVRRVYLQKQARFKRQGGL